MLFGEGPQIKNIAADLNKLFRQGSILNQSGQTVDGDSTADQGTSDLLAARDPVIQEISVGMSGEQSARYTVSGTPPLSLPNSLGKPLKAWSVDLLPYQEGTGDPAPDNVRPIHGTDKLTITTAGKNLCDPNEVSYLPSNVKAYTTNGYLLQGGTSYTFSVSTQAAGMYIVQYGTTTNLATKYNSTYVTYTPTADVLVTFDAYYSPAPSGGTQDITCQLEFGSTVTPYTPYLAPSQTVLTLPQTVYTGTIGSEGGESRWGEVDLGTLNWGTPTDAGRIYATTVIDNFAVPTTVAERAQGFMCEQYKPSSSLAYSDSMDNCSILRNINTNNPLYLRNSAFAGYSGEQIKTALTGVKFIYELATPTTFPLTTPTIPTPTGTAATWATAEDGIVDTMEVTYIGKA